MGRTIVGYLAAVVVAHIVGAAAASAHVISRHESMTGESVGFSDRLGWMFGDIAGMLLGGIYVFAIAVALLLAFAIAGFVVRKIGGLRTLGFVFAGAVGLFAMHSILGSVFEMHPIAATRDSLGLLGQMLAGALGGAAYVAVHPARANQAPSPQ